MPFEKVNIVICSKEQNSTRDATVGHHLPQTTSSAKWSCCTFILILSPPMQAKSAMLSLVLAAICIAQALGDYDYPTLWNAATLVNSTVRFSQRARSFMSNTTETCRCLIEPSMHCRSLTRMETLTSRWMPAPPTSISKRTLLCCQ